MTVQPNNITQTDKSMAELEIELQYTFDWSKASESNKKLVPLYGPGFTGLDNLGNTHVSLPNASSLILQLLHEQRPPVYFEGARDRATLLQQ